MCKWAKSSNFTSPCAFPLFFAFRNLLVDLSLKFLVLAGTSSRLPLTFPPSYTACNIFSLPHLPSSNFSKALRVLAVLLCWFIFLSFPVLQVSPLPTFSLYLLQDTLSPLLLSHLSFFFLHRFLSTSLALLALNLLAGIS